jgi:colicin import membrane protein
MNTAAMQRDLFMPRQPGGMGRGLMLAIAAHILLVLGLSFSVNWHTAQTPEGVEAELWAAVPQFAAPRPVDVAPPVTPPAPPVPKPVPRVEPVAPPPPRPDANIAIERAQREEREQLKRQTAERDEQERKNKLALQKQQQAEEAKRQQKIDEAEAARLAALREANLKRIMGQAGATGDAAATGSAAQSAGPSASYLGRIKARIKPNVSFPDTVEGNPAVEIEVRLTPEGRVIDPSRVVKSSGVKEWDDAVLRAIGKTEVLPKDEAGRVPPSMIIVYRPRD